ncbi:hypothetical protein [Rhizobium sp. SU303]|uniref:hypothetical protein n=1 Tax=Rhizobium sp. SU303 TaxID=3138065 RepID=UPI001E5BD587|nr:hypothetical protein [Rhizobium leguminosarum]UFW80144.1 hypothetical protein RlegSU303_09560 [Rhizobium leguminosarum bv. viciae]
MSFDKPSASMACSIQIKTILNTTKGVTVSLSVVERLAQSPTPAFIYIIRLDDQRKPFQIRAFHRSERF